MQPHALVSRPDSSKKSPLSSFSASKSPPPASDLKLSHSVILKLTRFCSPHGLLRAVFHSSASILSKNPISIHREDYCPLEVEAEAHFLQTCFSHGLAPSVS